MKKIRKKIIVSTASSLVILAMGTIALAASEDSVTLDSVTSQEIDVTGSYVAGQEEEIVRSVDIAWGAMEFTYTISGENVWNTETYEYDYAQDAIWSYEDNANKITVTNHSNTEITALLSFTNSSAVDDNVDADVIGTFYENNDFSGETVTELTLATAVGTTVAEAPTSSAYLYISGSLTKDFTSTVGTVTVTLQ